MAYEVYISHQDIVNGGSEFVFERVEELKQKAGYNSSAFITLTQDPLTHNAVLDVKFDSYRWTGYRDTGKKFLTFTAVRDTIARIMEVVMPYISDDDKFEAMADPGTPGELNYKITMACADYLEERAEVRGGLSYDLINEVIGVLECAKQEIYRRVAIPYEDQKIKENGDVYPDTLQPPFETFPKRFEKEEG